MERREIEERRRFGSVKAAIDMYGGRTLEGNSNSAAKKPQLESSEKPSSRTTRELHLARGEIGRFDESKRVAESMKSKAESELSAAKKTVKELTSRIEVYNSKAKGYTLEGCVKKQRDEEEELELEKRKVENHQYAEVMRELESVKQDLSKLKLDMASVMEQKKRAEKDIEASSSRFWSFSSSADALKKEIEEVNEEQVLVELAKIEAVKELEAIEEQRRQEHTQFAANMENTKNKMNELLSEIDQSRELETKLTLTTSDVDMLQNELKMINDMEKMVQRSESFRLPEDGSEILKEELEAAKNEIASIADERFQFMTSMDLVRNELHHVLEEIDRFRKSEAKTDAKLQSLGNKLLRAKAKLQAMNVAEETGKLTASNLSLTLDQMKTEAEVARKEKELICEETAKFQAEAQKAEEEMDLAERKLHDMVQELEAVKSSESVALGKLKSLSESAARNRASSYHQNTTITISRFEYEYLTGSASAAEEIANKKVAAAQAWIEALKASEKEILMKVDIALRKKREIRVEESRGTREAETTLPPTKIVMEEDTEKSETGTESNLDGQNLQVESEFPRKPVKGNGYVTPARRARYRKSMSPATRHGPRSGSLTVVKRKKTVPDLGKLFNGKNIETDT